MQVFAVGAPSTQTARQQATIDFVGTYLRQAMNLAGRNKIYSSTLTHAACTAMGRGIATSMGAIWQMTSKVPMREIT